MLKVKAYLLSWDQNTKFLTSLLELIRVKSTIVVEIVVLECLKHDSLLTVGVATDLLGSLSEELLLKARFDVR